MTCRFDLRLLLVTVALLGAASTRPVSAQERLFTGVGDEARTLSAEQARLMGVIEERPFTESVSTAELASDPASLLRQGTSLVLDVSPEKSFTVSIEKVQRKSQGLVSSRGTIQGGPGLFTLVLTSQGITGALSSGSEFYNFEPLGENLQALIKSEDDDRFRDHPPGDSEEDAGATEPGALPDAFSLAGNYPNPFDDETRIQFALPEAVKVALVVYDLQGRRVETLVDRRMPAGVHRVAFGGERLASGVYLYRLTAEGGFEGRGKMVVVR